MLAPTFQMTPRQVEANELLAGPQRHTAIVGGSRSGKTTLLVRATCVRALRAAESRHAILRFRGNAARSSISLDTLPKVIKNSFPGVTLKEHRQDGFFELPNKSQVWVGGLDDDQRVEKILGQEYATIFFNECSQISYHAVMIGLTRLAQKVPGLQQRAYFDLNPVGKSHWTYRLFKEKVDPQSRRPLVTPDDYQMMFLNPTDNSRNLDPAYLQTLASMPERHRKRFYEGEYVDELDGALWTYELIEKYRVEPDDAPIEDMARVVVAVDPSGAGSKEETSADEIGITVEGKGHDGDYYVYEDASVRDGPAGWGRRAVGRYHHYQADYIVAEKNFGGAMVAHVIKSIDPNVKVKLVTASRGKAVRAEPVATLYERGQVHHVGRHPRLEDQLCAFTTAGYMGDESPDRADSLVWGISSLAFQNNQQTRTGELLAGVY